MDANLDQLLEQNLVLRKFCGNKEKWFIKQRPNIPDLLADPIAILRQDRTRNAGGIKYTVFDAIDDRDANDVVDLAEIEFPSEYDYLLELEALDEWALRSNKILWETLTKKAVETTDIINKELALICLSWAQSKLDAEIPILEQATLKYSHRTTEKHQSEKNTTVVILELMLNDKELSKYVRKGSIIKFMRLSTKETLPLWAKVKVVSKKYIQAHAFIRSVKSNSGKRKLDSFIRLNNEEVSVFEIQPDFIPQSMLRSIERIKMGELNNIVNPTNDCDDEDIFEFRKSFKRVLPTLKAYTGIERAPDK